MKKLSFLSLAAVCAAAVLGTANAQAETTYMDPATLDYPSGLYASFPPSAVDITWASQPIELIDATENEYGDMTVTTYVKLGEGEKQPVSASILSSFGDPENPDDIDIWNLSIALYELDDLWAFAGNTVTVIVPEGIVKNAVGDVNPAQEFVFQIVPTFTDYTYTPESESTLTYPDMKVKVSFGDGVSLSRLQSEVALRLDNPYKEYILSFGKEVTITAANELEIDLSDYASGYYELVIPEGYVMIETNSGQYLCPDIWLEYNLQNDGAAAVGIIGVDNTANSVYTLDGRPVSASQNAGLEKGLYIIGGKKIFICK